MDEKKLNRNMYFTLICSLIILIAIAFSGTYSFFVATIKDTGDDRSTSLQAGSIASLTITGDSEVPAITDMIPEDRYTRTFTITNSSEFDAKNVTLVWKNVVNEFVNKDDLIIILKNTTTNEELIKESSKTPFPSSDDEVLISGINIGGSSSNDFELTIYYVNDPINNQMIDVDGNPIDMGRAFGGEIEILQE